MAKKRKSGTGTVRQRGDGRWEGRVVIGYDDSGLPKTKNVLAKTKRECQEKLRQLTESMVWPDGTQHSRNVYAHTREECEEKLKALITEMNGERKNLKEQLAGIAPPEKLTKKQRKLWDYMRLHPEVTEFSTIAKRTGLARNTVKKHYGMIAAMLGRK